MYTRLPVVFFILLFICWNDGLLAQRKVLGYPQAYESPLNTGQINNAGSGLASKDNWLTKSRESGWWVVPDRLNVKAYDAPKAGARTSGKLKWGKSYFVTDTDGDYLKLIDGSTNGLKVNANAKKVGWVKSGELLLWKNALVNPRTKISLKCLLLNQFDDINYIPCDNQLKVNAYKDPNGVTPIDSTEVYSFYFVYKIDGNRYLLGTSPSLRRNAAGRDLLGWVDGERLAEWNTRIALEPNFSPEGYEERKSNERFQVLGYDKPRDAIAVSRTGKIDLDAVRWGRDPVNAEPQELSKTDKRRLLPGLMRFPLLSVSTGAEELEYFRSAVCDQVVIQKECDPATGLIDKVIIKPVEALEMSGFLDRYRQRAENFHVFFVVENSERMAAYKNEIAGLADEIKRSIGQLRDGANIRVGAMAYGEYDKTKRPEELIEFQELTSNTGSFERFINGLSFSNESSNGNYPVQNYAIDRALQLANFSDVKTNILVVLGAKGDFNQDRLKRRTYPGGPLVPDRDDITNLINDGTVDILGIQCVGGRLETDKAFTRNLQGIMIQAATKNYNRTLTRDKLDPRLKKDLENNNISHVPPSMADPDREAANEIALEGGTINGEILRIQEANQGLAPMKLTELVTEKVVKSAQESIELGGNLQKLKSNKIPKSGYTPKMIEIMQKLYKSTTVGADISSEKVELYKQIYFSRQPKGAAHSSFNYVLFWTSRELTSYKIALQKRLVDVGETSGSDRRNHLMNLYCDMLDKFTGGKATDANSEKSCEDYTIEEVNQIIQGVSKEGVTFGTSTMKIGSILDKRVVSETEIDTMYNQLNTTYDRMEEILSGNASEFTFSRGSANFYWVKVEDCLL